ncbi:SAM-dependent methyltransferase [Saccharopolyspora erythraea]|uniref:SAM-dependent methyltransferase n=1 Tax=Saccharopolyspora erythraea TaxID=1836 RepID=UPI001BABA6E2|nr:SAM-dependent methyltransferase [Saccharopolyspora erythraea]QUH02230.1 SAM-dependent methyltransferase [Saccharopolyspora erythraea]
MHTPETSSSQHSGPPGTAVDHSVPSVARIYDYAIGGKDNFKVDRDVAQALVAEVPEALLFARENRSFLRRAVRFLAAECGVRQFIDNGSGLPTADNVHQIAQRCEAGARVVYIDNDPVVLAYGRALLADDGNTAVLQADMTAPDKIIADARTRQLIDFTEQTAVLYVSVLHCVPDEAAPRDVVARMLDAVPSGSYLVLSHIVSDDREAAERFTKFMTSSTAWGRVRSPQEVAEIFDGLELLEPGLVDVVDWRPDSSEPVWSVTDSPFGEFPADPEGPKKLWELGGIARKP